MPTTQPTPFQFRFRKSDSDDAYTVEARSDGLGETAVVPFTLPFDEATRAALSAALEPGFDPDQAPEAVQEALRPFPSRAQQLPAIGEALAGALLADAATRSLFGRGLALAAAAREPLPVALRFGAGCAAVAALPWELLRHDGRFLVADGSIALSRYPEAAQVVVDPLGALPLRLLLVLAEPVDAGPILPQEAKRELLHGLRTLDEAGAVIVDVLRPPTYDTLSNALLAGDYHALIFYGHGAHGDGGGELLFEDEYGGQNPVPAERLGRALHNTGIRLVLLGACRSATTRAETAAAPAAAPAPGRIWQGTAQALIAAGVPLTVGMQTSMRVDAALAFLRQFALSLAAGKSVVTAVADGRRPLNNPRYDDAWYMPALYARTPDGSHLFDPAAPLPAEGAALRARMQALRAAIDRLESEIAGVGTLNQPQEIARLRRARREMAETHAALAQQTPGGYAPVVSPLYGVPGNDVFVGRETEIKAVARALRGEQPVVVWGTGGIGKTALATEVAHRQSWRFPAGVLWLDCRGGPALDTLLETIGGFCGVDLRETPPAQKASAARQALAALGEARCLLVWDNAEDVWEDDTVQEFIVGLPHNCQALLTTRLNPKRAMWRKIELAPLADEPMERLFYALASAAGVKIGQPSDLESIPQIVRFVQGHPLAMTLVVPIAEDEGLTYTWELLQAQPLEGIEAAFVVSYERLSPAQQMLFTRLSVFAIPFERAAVAALAGHNDTKAWRGVVQRALVQFDGARYAYHALVRQYAYAQLQRREDVRDVHRLAAEYLHGLREERQRTPEEVLEEVDRWEQAEAWPEFARAASALVGSLDRQGYWPEIRERLARARAAAEAHVHDPTVEAQLLNALAAIAYKSAAWEEAIGLCQQAQAIYEDAGDERGMAQTLGNLGSVYARKGEWDRAIGMYEQARATLERVGDSHGMAQTLGNLGLVYARKGEWDRAIGMYEQARATLERVGDSHGMAQTLGNLGLVYADKGEWDRAIEYYEKDLAISERVGDSHGMAQTYNNLGSVYYRQGEWDRAIGMYEQALATFERVGDSHGMAQTYNNLGSVYADKGEWDRAIGMYEQARATKERVGDSHGMASTYNNLGLVYARKGEWDRAIGMYKQALATLERVGDSHGMAQTLGNLGSVYARKGEWDRAIEYYEKDLAISERVGDSHGMAQTYNNLGSVYADKGEWDRAIGMYEQARATKERVGDSHGMASTYNNLGLVYARKGEWDRAIGMYKQALATLERVGDSHGMAQTLGNLGSVYARKGEWDRAIEYYEKDLAISERVGDSHGMASTYGNLGNFYQAQGDSEKAANYMARAFLIFSQLGARPGAEQAGRLLVEILGSADAANDYLQQFIAAQNNEED